MELYKYTGSVAVLTVRFGKAETITLYDSYDDSVAPVRLDVRGALAEYIKEIESTDSEERYMNLDWYYDFNMLLRRIEVPGVPSEKFQMTGVPAKVLTQTRSNPDELVCFGCPDFINTSRSRWGQTITRTSSCGSVRTEIKEVQTMKRYQILYNKAGFPLCVWKSSEEEARSFANRFRAAGYSVDVWEHTATGARKTNI